jgi:hypothetical protein
MDTRTRGVSSLSCNVLADPETRDFPFGGAAVLGIAYGFGVMALMTSLIVPAVNPVMAEHLPSLGGAWVLARSLFGATLGLAPWLRRRLAADAPDGLASR